MIAKTVFVIEIYFVVEKMVFWIGAFVCGDLINFSFSELE